MQIPLPVTQTSLWFDRDAERPLSATSLYGGCWPYWDMSISDMNSSLRQPPCGYPYLRSTVHVALAHRMRGYRWADDPAAIQAMAAFTDNFTRLCLAAPHISARAPALREVISLIRILGHRTSKRIQDDG